MHRPLSRTSITIDEAVANLLGWSTGPFEFKPNAGAEDAEAEEFEESDEAEDNRPALDVREILGDELDVVAGEYRLAKVAKQPAHVIDEKLAALRRKEAEIAQANVYLSAIQDELNKGAQSALRVDRTLSNAAYTYITWHSFTEWVKRIGNELAGEHRGAAASAASSPAPEVGTTKRKPRTKLRQQEDAIVAELQRQKFDPVALPARLSGEDWVKTKVREALDKRAPFEGLTTFDYAWERLRKDGRIVEKSGPPPPK